MWWLAGAIFLWVMIFLSTELALYNLGYMGAYTSGYYTVDHILPCYVSFTFVPSGLTSIAGILSAASFVLHGHFVTLVPEALHNLYPPASAPAKLEVQPPQVVNSQHAVLLIENVAAGSFVLPEPGPNDLYSVVGGESVFLTVIPSIVVPDALPVAADA
jgi:hypothetical protein